jgi:predicted transcriptional regulator
MSGFRKSIPSGGPHLAVFEMWVPRNRPARTFFLNASLTAQTRAPRLAGMEVHFTPEQEAQLSELASHAGTDTERLVKDAALRLLEQDARFRAAVREGIAQADRGEFIEEEEMEARIERMLNS